MTEEYSNKLLAMGGFGALLIGLSIGGLLFGVKSRVVYHRPESVYTEDVNKDGRPDLIVRGSRGREFIFLQQSDGSYKALKKAEEKNLNTLTGERIQSEKTIEEKVK